MNYHDLLQLYFDRSNALQWYWTLYVVIVGGLLAFSSLRKEPDLLTGILVSLLFCFFAYKNLGAIHDTTLQRSAALETLKHIPPAPNDVLEAKSRQLIEPTLVSPEWEGTRNFHVASDMLTLAAIWAKEWRRVRRRRLDARLVK